MTEPRTTPGGRRTTTGARGALLACGVVAGWLHAQPRRTQLELSRQRTWSTSGRGKELG